MVRVYPWPKNFHDERFCKHWAVLVLPSVFRDVVLYTFVSETDRDVTMQVTDLQTKTRFPVSVPAGQTAMVLIDRHNGRLIT